MRIGTRILALVGLSVALTGAAHADKFPDRLVTIVVPYAPGGATDIVARTLADQLSKKFNQSFIVQNKPGAFGMTAMQEVVRQNADGYTLFVGNVSTNAITPLLFAKKMTFKYEEGLMPVTKLAEIPGVLVTTTVNFEPKTVAELIAYGKKNPGKMNYASPGIGSYPQYDTEIFNRAAGIDVLHIPLKGGASDMVTSLISGDTQFGFVNAATAEGMMKAGRLRGIAVVAPERLKTLPNIPTMAEAGFPNIGTLQWQGLFVRRGTPPDVLDTLFKAATEVMRSEQTAKTFEPAGVAISPSASIQQAQAWQTSELDKWRAITSQVKVDLD